jgi:hypothetical protein
MAGLIPQSFIDDLLNRTDIVDVVSSRVQLKKAGKNYTACCPFHKEKTPSFSVSSMMAAACSIRSPSSEKIAANSPDRSDVIRPVPGSSARRSFRISAVG